MPDKQITDRMLTSELLELIDDVACLLQNPTHYGIVLRRIPSRTRPGIPFRDEVIAKLARVSPPVPTGRRPGRPPNRKLDPDRAR